MDHGPYRSAGALGLRCPRCNGPADGEPTRYLTCVRGCGEWWSKEALSRQLSWADLQASEPDVPSLLGRPFPAVPCPVCLRTMTVSVRRGVAFDHCGDHGVWLDRGERVPFEDTFEIVTGVRRR